MYYMLSSYNKVVWGKENYKEKKTYLQYLLKRLHVSGPMQFQPAVFKGQLYCVYIEEHF